MIFDSFFESDVLLKIARAALILCIWAAGNVGMLFLIHWLLTLPMRRSERARLFLDLVERALNHGQQLEMMIISLAQTRESCVGKQLHQLAAKLKGGSSLSAALPLAPGFLPPQVSAMLKTGLEIGDVRKVLPASRQLLHDAVSKTRGAIHYLIILLFVLTPVFLLTFTLIMTFVMPRFLEISSGMGTGATTGVSFLVSHAGLMALCEVVLLLMIWCAAIIYIGGPGVVAWFPILERIHYRLPWRRKRMQRDFSCMLAILLDSGVPEPDSVRLAAHCTANKVFKWRASGVVENLKRGVNLAEAIQAMDDAGEFRWRLTNATHTNSGFMNSLKGWHESLDAKAFQQEQAAAHFTTTGLVLLNGVFVGIIMVSVFSFLISIINAGVLW